MERMRLLVFCFSLLATGCFIDEQSLYGDWQATAFTENTLPLAVALDSVRLSFDPNGTYRFTTVGYYREGGYFRTSMHYLLLTDTTMDPPQDHILKIVDLSADTLTLRMEQEGKQQVLVLARRKEGS